MNEITKKGLIIFAKDTPEEFIATNSEFSPSLPKTITDDNNIAIGNAIGTNLADA